MKTLVLFLMFFTLCNGAPAPQPDPRAKPAPEPKPNPGLLLPSNPAIVTSPVVTYAHYIKSPIYPTYHPYIYNLGYASAYSYNVYPYYVPIQVI